MLYQDKPKKEMKRIFEKLALQIMGVVNVTPDSFSDGGDTFDVDTAIRRGFEFAELGCSIVDVGGESTRPGALVIDEEEELRRVIPVIRALSKIVRVSVDTSKPLVARRAVDAGATIINDISASLAEVAASTGAGWVAMHMQGEPQSMQDDPRYENVVSDVRAFLAERAAWAHSLGIAEVWLDPGIGFGKSFDHNLDLLAKIGEIVDLGYPVLVGTSRKTFIAKLASIREGSLPSPKDRLEGSLATAAWCYSRGVSVMRVHDVAEVTQLCLLFGQV